MPDLPTRIASQDASVPIPSGVSKPTPVTTTLLDKTESPGEKKLLFGLILDVFDSVLHGGDFFRVLVRDFELESLFKGHHQLDDVQRIGAQIVHERRVAVHLALIHAKLFHNNLLDLLL